MDLPKENTMQLMGAGVPKENIFDPGFCTLCENNDFFSFRKEGKDCGRIISVVMLK
jgi:copper oxidase (laccase) domain-containing protein